MTEELSKTDCQFFKKHYPTKFLMIHACTGTLARSFVLQALSNFKANVEIFMFTQLEIHFLNKTFVLQIALGLLANFSSVAPSMSLGFSAIAIPALTYQKQEYRLTNDQLSWFGTFCK